MFSSAGKKKEVPSDAPTVIEEVKPVEPEKVPEPLYRPSPFRKLFWLMLFLTILFAVLFYLTYTGSIKDYIDLFDEKWKKIAVFVENLIKK